MPLSLRILILEDNASDARLIVSTLRQAKFDVEWERVDGRADYLSRLHANWDIILSDYSMPQFNAIEALALLRERDIDIPFIIISGSIGEDIAVSALQQGAADYLLKDRLGRLPEAVRHALDEKQMRELRRRDAAALLERGRLASLTADVGVVLTTSDSLRDALRICTDSLVSNLGAAFARIWTLNEADNILELQASSGMYVHVDGPHSRVPVGQLDIGQIAQTRTPRLSNDLANDPLISDRDWADREGMVAFAGYPLIDNDQLIGVMALFARYVLTPSSIEAMASVANLIALGIRRRRADEAVLSTAHRLKHVLASSPAVLYHLAVQEDTLVPLWVSDNVESFTGFSVQEALAPDWWTSNVHPDDRDRITERIRRLLPECGHVTNEYRFRHRDGTYHWLRSEKRLLRDEQGKPTEVIGSWSDIADLKRSETHTTTLHGVTRVLAASPSVEEALHRILKTICEAYDWPWGAYWHLDNSSQVMRCLTTWHRPSQEAAEFEAVSRMFTFSQGKGFPGRIWSTRKPLWNPDLSQDRQFARASEAERAGLRCGFGVPVLLNKEVFGIVEFFAAGMPQPDDDLLRIMTDIASQIGQFLERKRAEDELRTAQKRLQHVVDSSPSVLFTLGVAGPVITGISWMSDNVAQMLGYPVEQALGPNWWHANIHADDLASTMASVHRDLFASDHVANEYRFRHSDGKYRWLRSELRLLRDASGEPLEAIGSWSDITERKSLEEQYRQAQKMEAVGRLAGGVAHDFNNLLTVIMGFSELFLANLRPEDPLRTGLSEIHKAGERAAGLTRQLLAFSRKQVLMPVVLDLNKIIVDMERMLGRLIGEDVALSVHAEQQLWKVKADAGQIEQVVMNITVNARDAMPMGGKLLIETKNVELNDEYVASHTEARPDDYVLLAITDTGSGMDATVRSRIFEPFFTTKGPNKGTGLGLATVFGIVKQSGGHIEVYSEVGHGTTFKIYLPRDKSGDPISSPRTHEPVRGGKETILLVEDEEGLRQLTMTVLRGQGYTVIDASHGGQALMICEARTEPIHLMITDVVMPHISGRQLAERLVASRPQMKVLFMSGYTDDSIVHHGVLESGMPFLQKPFTPDMLARKVREVLDSK